MNPPSVAIVGAGMAGLACATELVRHGVSPVVYDKGRGAGGRMATRRAELGGATLHFDHGAQYFTARNSAFLMVIADWLRQGVVAPWPSAGDSAYVGTPGMNAPLKHMSDGLNVRWNERVLAVRIQDNKWQVESENGTETYSHVAIALPAEQAAELLADAAPDFAAQAARSVSDPCWAVMAAFPDRLPIEADIIRSREGPISWAARNNAKPGRGAQECWVLHASPDTSRAMLELDKEDAAAQLLSAFFVQSGITPAAPSYLTAHRWRYAQAQRAEGDAVLWDGAISLGVAGDWLSHPRVEGAWLSGRALAEKLIGSF